jgi:hypothetical protein
MNNDSSDDACDYVSASNDESDNNGGVRDNS